jgi:hypothetical protein
MNKGKWIIALPALIAILAIPSTAQRSSEGKTGLSCTMIPVKTEVLPFETIEFMFTVRNETDTPNRVNLTFDPWILYPARKSKVDGGQGSNEGGIGWKAYRGDTEWTCQLFSQKFSLAPGEVRTTFELLEYEKHEHKLAFPGRYLFKGRVDGWLACNEVQITVRGLEGVDERAYEYLQQHPLHFFFHSQTMVRYDKVTVEMMKQFIARFQGSQYAEMAQLGLALMWMKGVEGKKDLEQARSLLQEVVKSSDEARAARAYYYLGQLAEEQGELMDAHQYYSYALSLKVDPYIEYVAKEAQTKLEPRLSPPKQKLPRR